MESDSDSSERLVANYFEHHSDDFEYFDDSSSSEEEDEGDSWLAVLQKVKDNDPKKLQLAENGQNINARLTSCRKWEEIGRDVSSNTRLECLFLSHGALDDNKMSFFFRGLTGSCSIKFMQLHRNELSVEGVRTMASFFQNANNLRAMRLSNNNLKSEGFNVLLRALHSSHIEHLNRDGCGIESIEIDNNFFPKRLENLDLSKNNINAEGCRGLAKLLKGGNATLERLSHLSNAMRLTMKVRKFWSMLYKTIRH